MFVSVVVAYNPDVERLKITCSELVGAGTPVVVYDNSEPQSVLLPASNNIFLLGGGGNVGLAEAYNVSIDFARSSLPDVEGVLFFDQDSSVTSKNVRDLLSEYKKAELKNLNIGVLGATAKTADGVRYNLKEISAPDEVYLNELGFLPVWFVMSSFSLIPVGVFDEVGNFDEDLFIDLVDSEFSFRCRGHGYKNLISKKVEFIHEVGLVDVSLFGRRLFAISSPLRNYYQTRNVIVVGRKYKNIGFIMFVFAKRVPQFLISGLVTGSLFSRFGYILKGVRDAFGGRFGKYREKV